MNKYIIGILALLVIVGGVAALMLTGGEDSYTKEADEPEVEQPIAVEPDGGIGDGAEPIKEVTEPEDDSVIGKSVGGQDITVYRFGEGDNEVLFVGGTHGSYSPNTSELAMELVNHFEKNEDSIPDGVSLTIIPELNPDGSDMSGTAGRFNKNDVDLNRNFDCEWSETGVWREQEVSGGDAPFSEPEASALRDYVRKNEPSAAIVLFSAEGKVYPSACGGNPTTASNELAETYATAAGYPTDTEFDAYAITGDMVNWMAGDGITAISVLLSDHQGTEFSKNLAGLEAVLDQEAE